MPEWLSLKLIAGAVAVMLIAIPMFIKREKTVGWAFGWMMPLVKIWIGYDVPVVAGEQETKVKGLVSGTVGDLLLGSWLAWAFKGNKPAKMKEFLADLSALVAKYK